MRGVSRFFLTCAGLLLIGSAARCAGQSIPIPEYFGTYAVVDGQLLRLDGKTLNPRRTTTVRFASYTTDQQIQAGQPAALAPQSIQVPVFPADLKIVVYDNDSPNTEFQLRSLVFVKSMSLSRMNDIRPDRIRPSYPVNGWDNSGGDIAYFSGYPKQEFEFRFKPVAGHTNMVIAGLDDKLSPGVYRLSRNEGPMAETPLGAGNGIVFAVEPVSQGEATQCKNLTMVSYIAASQSKYSACTDSSPDSSSGVLPSQPPLSPVGGAGTIPGTATTCSDYDGCMRTGLAAYRSHDWESATAAFTTASQQRPSNGDPWVWKGRVLLQDGQQHHVEELAGLWDKGLALGARIVLGTCHEKTFQPCERGDLVLSKDNVSFLARGNVPEVSATPASIQPGRILDNSAVAHISYSFKLENQNFAVNFFPPGVPCSVNLMVQCPPEGIAKQLILAQYVSQVLPKLISGSLGTGVVN